MNYKNIILILIALGLCVPARSASLSTTDGTTYNNITAQRTDPDGLYLEYTLPGGGLGMSKVKFSRLSPDQQKQFGYNADKARDFEAKVARTTEDWRQEGNRLEQAAQAQRAAQQAREAQQDQVLNDRLVAMARLQQAQAALSSDAGGSGNYEWSSFGGGYGIFAWPRIGVGPHARTVNAPVVRPLTVPHPAASRPSR